METKLITKNFFSFLTISWTDNDSDEIKERKSAMIGFSVIMSMGGLLWGVLCLLDNLTIPSIIPFSYTLLIMPLVYLTSKFPKCFLLFANIQLFLSLALPFILQLMLGGFANSGSVMLWALSSLIGSILIVGHRKSLIWFVLYVAFVIFSGMIDTNLSQEFGTFSLSSSILFTINILCVTTMVYIVVRKFAEENNQNNIKLKNNIQALKQDLDQIYKKTLANDKLVSLGEIAARVGHEINNPLTIAVGNLHKVESIIHNMDINLPEIENIFEKQRIAHQRIRDIVNSLRIYSRSDNELIVINLKDAIDQSVDLIKDVFEESGVRLVYNKPIKDVFIKGSISKIQQITFNLLQNAKDATAVNKSERVIKISLECSHEAIITVCDNGSGIPEGIKHKIFDPFYTTKDIGEGTGIGLGVVNEYVNAMSGSLEVQSETNKGSAFILKFPVNQNFKTKVQTIDEQEEENILVPSTGNKILIVEDEEDIRDIFIEMLSHNGHDLDEAANGIEALELISKKEYEIILTDMSMPKMGGLALLHELKKRGLAVSTIKVLITGDVSIDLEDHKNPFFRLVDFYIKKPFDYEEIIKLMSHVKKVY
jgi:signal transduction histidine kinase/ActR/RegA family two-component response regulator